MELFKKLVLSRGYWQSFSLSSQQVLLQLESILLGIKKDREILNSWTAESKNADEILYVEEEQNKLLDKETRVFEEFERDQLRKILDEVEESEFLKSDFSKDGCIFEIKSSSGGEEAELFSYELLKMYEKYCSSIGLDLNVIDLDCNSTNSLRHAVAEITAAAKNSTSTNIFSRFLLESGIHQVKRVPATETKGRLHTSTAVITTMPLSSKNIVGSVDLQPKDLKIFTMRSNGAGGQGVQKHDSAVRITHLPTGLTARSDSSRSQHQNRELAMKTLSSRVLLQAQKKQLDNLTYLRSTVIGGILDSDGKPARTYHYNQQYITDHRLNLNIRSGLAFSEIISGIGLDKYFTRPLETAILRERLSKFLGKVMVE